MKLSIITPTHNRAQVLGRAIKSVLSQSFKNWELLIVDDGSQDNTKEVIKKFQKKTKKIKHLKSKKNQGFYPARNRGVLAACGDWVCFLDSDDEYLPNALKTMAGKLADLKKNVKIAQFNTIVKKANGQIKKAGYRLGTQKWFYYFPTLEDIVFKKNLKADMHRCIRIKTARKNPFPKDNPGLETLYYADLLEKGAKPVYINKTIVCINQDCADQHNLARFQKWPKEFAQVYGQLIDRHHSIFEEHPQKLFDHYMTISKCYLSAKNFLAVYWLFKAFFLKPKRFLRLVFKRLRIL